MKVTVNGEERTVPRGVTVDVIARDVLDRPRGVAVAVNGRVVPRSAWGDTPLDDDDAVEVLTARQGG